MNVPKDLRYTKTHEWVRKESDGRLTIGITDFAQHQLSELTYVELPEAGHADAESEVAVVESVKAASDVYAPVSGEIVEVNANVADHNDLINTDPYGQGWMFRMKADNAADVEKLLSPSQYQELLPKE